MSKQVIDKGEPPRSIFSEDPVPHFKMRMIPISPDVRRRMVRSGDGGQEMTEEIEINLGCPCCHQDIAFRWVAGTVDATLVHRMHDLLMQIGGLEFHLFARRLIDRERLDKLTELAEDLLGALRRW